MKIKIKNNVLGIEDKGNFTPVKGVITHKSPDIDALVPPWMFKYQRIQIGQVYFKSAGEGGLIEGKTPQEWLKEGFILIDVGAGESKRPEDEEIKHFDHHPATYYPDQCSTSLVFEFIASKINMTDGDKERLEKLVNFVRSRDLRGGQQFLDLAHICKILAIKIPAEELYQYISEALTVYIDNQEKQPNVNLFEKIFNEFANGKKLPLLLKRYWKNFLEGKTQNIPDVLRITSPKTKDFIRLVLEEAFFDQTEFENAGEIFQKTKKIPLNADKFMAVAETDNNQFFKVALREGAILVVVKNSKGHVQIFTQKKDGVNIADIAAAIRYEEARLSGNKELVNFEALHRDGTSEIAKNWYLFKHGGMLLNGSSTTPDQKPTGLGLEKITETIQIAHSSYMPLCKGGQYECSINCNLYGWGLERCQRRQRRNNKERTVRRGETPILIM